MSTTSKGVGVVGAHDSDLPPSSDIPRGATEQSEMRLGANGFIMDWDAAAGLDDSADYQYRSSSFIQFVEGYDFERTVPEFPDFYQGMVDYIYERSQSPEYNPNSISPDSIERAAASRPGDGSQPRRV